MFLKCFSEIVPVSVLIMYPIKMTGSVVTYYNGLNSVHNLKSNNVMLNETNQKDISILLISPC